MHMTLHGDYPYVCVVDYNATGLVDSTSDNDCGFHVPHRYATDHRARTVCNCLRHHSQWCTSLFHICHGETMETQASLSGHLQWLVKLSYCMVVIQYSNLDTLKSC